MSITAKIIENDLKAFTGGSFIRPKEIAKFLGTKEAKHIKWTYEGLPVIEGTTLYYIPEVAERIYKKRVYR